VHKRRPEGEGRTENTSESITTDLESTIEQTSKLGGSRSIATGAEGGPRLQLLRLELKAVIWRVHSKILVPRETITKTTGKRAIIHDPVTYCIRTEQHLLYASTQRANTNREVQPPEWTTLMGTVKHNLLEHNHTVFYKVATRFYTVQQPC
jgi:hypothetical protein